MGDQILQPNWATTKSRIMGDHEQMCPSNAATTMGDHQTQWAPTFTHYAHPSCPVAVQMIWSPMIAIPVPCDNYHFFRTRPPHAILELYMRPCVMRTRIMRILCAPTKKGTKKPLPPYRGRGDWVSLVQRNHRNSQILRFLQS